MAALALLWLPSCSRRHDDRSSALPSTTTTVRGQQAATTPTTAAPRVTSVRATKASWSLPAPLSREAVAVDGGRIVVAGGLSTGSRTTGDTYRLDPATGAVTRGAALTHPVHDTAGAVLGGRPVLLGGGSQAVGSDVQSVDAKRSTVIGHLPTPRADLSSVTVSSTTYVIGGYDGKVATPDILATTDGTTFTVVGQLHTPVRYPAVAAVGHVVYVFGGEAADGDTTEIQAIDLATREVRVVAHLPVRLAHAVAVAFDGTVWVLGGRAGGTVTDAITRFDPVTTTTAAAGHLPAAVRDSAIATVDGVAYLLGGETSAPTSAVVRIEPVKTAPAAINVYEHAGAKDLSAAVADDPPRVYVPNSGSGTVSVIDPSTFKVIDTFKTGDTPQHVVPSHDLRTLWVNNNGGSLTPIDPHTGKPGATRKVADPYNMYFTPDGRYMIVVAEAQHRLDFRDPATLEVHDSVNVPCKGVNHIDFSADEAYFIATCEFDGKIIKVDTASHKLLGELALAGSKSQPQDVRLTPAGVYFYVADMLADGLHVIDGASFTEVGFIKTGPGTHGVYPSRDGRVVYVTNRGTHAMSGAHHPPGSIAVVDPAKGDFGAVVDTWVIPGGGSPDMGNVTADGTRLWLSGRYDSEVYCFDTATGKLLARIPVGTGPHGLTVWPQPGRYSLGHTGNMR